MNELFPEQDKPASVSSIIPPLAERIRPKTIDEVIGQEHILGQDAPLRRFFESGSFPSIIFWGPPGVGKTTIALLISEQANYNFERLSAVESGVKEVRQVINNARLLQSKGKRTLLFIDEIHRFSKSQQDALLHAVEKGIVTLIGATTENPSFEVISALLSRCQVYKLHLLSDEGIRRVVENAMETDPVLKSQNIMVESWDFLLNISAGDARTALNAIELATKIAKGDEEGHMHITRDLLEKALQQRTAHYDKKGETHYDTISAFIKSMRGSDPDASLFWLAKMLDAGEDARFIARRMVIFASEDIGNADPYALTLAIAVFHAAEMIGMPEARINLAQGVTYLASCPKSNASYMGVESALETVRSGVSLSVPLHLRNAPTKLMKDFGYHEGYKYPHSFEGGFVRESYFPDSVKPKAYYKPGDFGKEKEFKERLLALWKDRYGQDK